jgi:hypothetical protein
MVGLRRRARGQGWVGVAVPTRGSQHGRWGGGGGLAGMWRVCGGDMRLDGVKAKGWVRGEE